MFLLRVACAGLLLSPLVGLAQSPATAATDAPVHKFYVGLAAYNSYYQPFGRYGTATPSLPVQLTAGYQLSPKLALQAGLAYSGTSNQYFYAGKTFTGPGTPGTYFETRGTSSYRNYSASVLARYTLTNNAAHRVQFDALGGLGLEVGTFRSRGSQLDSAQSALLFRTYDNRSTRSAVVLSLGGSVRYRLSHRLDLVYDLTFNRRVGENAFRQQELITTSNSLGLRYRFGKR